MRRLSFVVAALLAAGCQVDTEGAACETDAHCPGGQACGLDGTCSTRAAACDERCTPGERRCADGDVKVCATSRNPVCGSWEIHETCEGGLVCPDGADACACAPAKDEFHFDPTRVASPDLAPTGAANPSACRLGSLDVALEKAAETGASARAVAVGPQTTYELPAGGLDVPAGVLLTTATPGEPAYTLEVPALTGTSPAAVRLGSGSGLEGFTIRNVGATAGVGVHVGCDAGIVILATVTVAAKAVAGSLDEGVRIDGSCSLSATNLEVSGAKGAALFVATSPDSASSVEGGSLRSSQEGLHLKSGKLVLRSIEVAENLAAGVAAGESGGGTEFEMHDCNVQSNGDTGIVLYNNTRLSLTGNEVTDNRAVTAWGGRSVGGVVFRTNPPPAPVNGKPATLVFQGNRIHGNVGDQAMVYKSTAPWVLDGSDCAALRNEFSCYGSGGVGLSSVDSVVSARRASWQSPVPTAPTDFRVVGAGSIDAGSDVVPELSCDVAPACQ
jgi:parallel beta-helix repeat protein